MQITLEIPDDLAAPLLAEGKNLARATLELLAVDGYRNQHLSEHQVRVILGLETRMEVHALLTAHGVPLHYTIEHLRQDIRASDLLHALRSVQAAHAR